MALWAGLAGSGFFSKAGVGGAFFDDPCHIRYTWAKIGVKDSGLWPAWLDGSALVGLRKRPWAGAAHMATLQKAAQNFWDIADVRPAVRLLPRVHRGGP